MFDIGWTEILVIATIAIVVVGPKDLPRMLRAFGKTMGQVRRMSNEFRRQFDDALREAERSAGLEETRKDLQSIAKANPLKDMQDDLNKTMASADKPEPKPAEKTEPTKKTEPTAVEAPAPKPDTDKRLHEAEPLKAGATSKQGSSAA